MVVCESIRRDSQWWMDDVSLAWGEQRHRNSFNGKPQATAYISRIAADYVQR